MGSKKKNKTKKSTEPSSLTYQFEKERLKLLNRAIAVGAILAGVLVPLFGLLDFILKPQLFWTFIAIRIGVTLVSIIILLISIHSNGNRFTYPLAAILTFTVTGAIAMMCHLDMGPTDPYYAGINLALIGFGILFPLTLSESIFVVSFVWLFYLIPNIIVIQPHEVAIFVSNNFFLVSTIIISIASNQFNFYNRKGQWNAHRQLKVAHKKIKNHANELEQKVQERTQRLIQSERLAVVGQLAGGVAHDFNNHLTAILGLSELLLSSLTKNDSVRYDIESINRVGKRAADLVKQLLAFSCRQILVPKTLSLIDVISDIEEMLRRLIGEDIELFVSKPQDLGCIRADPVQIEQIILNMSVNARDAMPGGGKLIIETANVKLDKEYCRKNRISLPQGDYVMLSISDTGMGMNETIKAKIFEPFFTTKEQGRGTGLGLSTVYGVVKQSQGDILVFSKEGSGTTFKIYFPLIKGPRDKYSKEIKKLPQLPKGKETILLVEDEDEVRRLTARMLEKQGYKVIQAREGKDALLISEKYSRPIDLLLTDVIMPRMNGKVLAEQLCTVRSDMKVLYMSGYIDKGFINKEIINSQSEFLPKPFTVETLSYKIRSILNN